jgi:soluble lytic murein transglycosylase-like protein
MPHFTRRAALFGGIAFLAACGDGQNAQDRVTQRGAFKPPLYANETPKLRGLINKYADHYEVPRSLVHRVIIRESHHRPEARNGPYYGLMQILPATAQGMGYQGSPNGLLDAETNLKYAVKYLRGAWLLSNGSQDAAVSWYSKGYYYEAKRRGMLVETGLRS